MPTGDTVNDVRWEKSEAKRLLAIDIINGSITPDMPWQDTYLFRPEYAETEFGKWYGRLRRLQKHISDAKVRAAEDEDGFKNDRLKFPVQEHDHRGFLRWEGSAAQSWMKIDIAAGRHKLVKPKELYNERQAYQQFPLDVFREHIYQEERFQKYCTWRNDTNQPKTNAWK